MYQIGLLLADADAHLAHGGNKRSDVTNQRIDAPGFPVEIYNVLGAGDAFAAGLIYGYLHGWDWYKSARMGNACGAIVVTRHGCANFMGYEQEVLEFIQSRGGF